jgi:hypothetical protein
VAATGLTEAGDDLFPQAALRLHDCLLPAPQTDFRETRRLSGLVHSLLARVESGLFLESVTGRCVV